jgi:uncharacterized protein YkwD
MLLVSIAAATLFGCEAGNDQSASPVVPSTEPVVSSSAQGVGAAVVASREVLSVTVSALSAPATTSTANPSAAKMAAAAPSSTVVVVSTTSAAPVPTTTEVPGEPVAFAANEMQLAPTTTRPPTTTTAAVRSTVPPTTAAPTFAPASAALPLNAAAAAEFQSRTNSLRASLGLASLSRNAQLDAYAAAWARELAAAGKLSHSSSPEAAIADGWNAAGENVGFGSTVASVQDALVSSAGHYANLARPTYSAIGVAVAVDAGGRLWVCEVFAG